ncbi:hypothetical protein TCAL_16122 [Tigriopus californicus]|uniref:AB hydrolase-1 domain-containing protein n=1 Tax=Tigriopus californicus TaxID=6832 RepID=A0A553PNA4_TIGCA|nr:serine hydrolase-like protein [Tigriopus californicus]TRY79156.1 hypothetical protein TCAL_16122 [Tigriopus californicus]
MLKLTESIIMSRNICQIVSKQARTFTTFNSLRANHTTETFSSEEISIGVPWGKIAIKTWGQGSKPMIGLHGWLDNAATFDRLVDYLPLNEFKLYSVDFPGHGWSDPIPKGMNYSATDALIVIKRLQNEFGWSKFDILGHSFGAGMAGWFASVFPDCVERLIMIDMTAFGPQALKKQSRSTRKSVEQSLKIHETLSNPNLTPPTYEWADAVGRAHIANQLMHGTDSIFRESVEVLMKRGLREVEPGKFTWNSDLRLRIPSPVHLVIDQVEQMATNIDCPHLLIKASDSPLYMSEEIAERVLKIYKNNNPDFEYRTVQGGHHIHLNEPEKIGPLIRRFLEKEFVNKDSEDKENTPLR